ncbi:MAG: hypothetical protein Q7R81_03165 [Candidatus Peregrinibacteria bacterium]|nr:hypothetical protein [Candidatus Peregrinibacteria bacterium]
MELFENTADGEVSIDFDPSSELEQTAGLLPGERITLDSSALLQEEGEWEIPEEEELQVFLVTMIL